MGESVGESIRRARTARGLSLRAVGRSIDVSAATLSAIETGKTGVSVTRLRAIAEALGTSAGELLSDPVAAAADPAPPDPAGWRHFAELGIDPVLRAAIAAFVETGYHGATMRSIAGRAAMSVPGVYHHYASKQDLLVRILDLTMSDLLWRVRAARAEGGTHTERLALIVESLALYHTHRRELAFIGSSEMRSLEPANRASIAALRTNIQRILDAEIAGGIADGHLATPDPRDAGRAISTMCTSLPQWFRAGGPSTPERIATEYARLALAMLGHRPPARRQSDRRRPRAAVRSTR